MEKIVILILVVEVIKVVMLIVIVIVIKIVILIVIVIIIKIVIEVLREKNIVNVLIFIYIISDYCC